MGSDTLAVQLVGIEKRFPGVIANHDVNLNVRAGTIHAIVGENGAGKSTLMKTLYGMHQPEAGQVFVGGELQHFRSPSDAIAAGIGMVHQHFMLADNLTVLENIVLGAEPASRGVIRFDEARRQLTETMKAIGAHVNLDAPVSELGVGQRQRVEILKVLYRGARILILDEPTAALGVKESRRVLELIQDVRRRGMPIILISHNMPHVFELADRIHVHRLGRRLCVIRPGEHTMSDAVAYMTGAKLPEGVMAA
ncbi:MAG TPA: hypothetical protein DCR14_12670 [Acidimicrobiaceae bacterium]|nr:hypothetical protein [Acidimicrobiaceae bacterium]